MAERIDQSIASQCVITERTAFLARPLHSPYIQVERVNPTKYEIQVAQAETPYLLVFSESFDLQWVLSMRPSTSSQGLPDDEEVAGHEVRHIVVNGYANGWWIDRPGTYEMTIEYLPQRWYQIGGVISGATLFLCLTYVTFLHIRRLSRRFL